MSEVRDFQRLTITFEHQYGEESVTYTRPDIVGDELFWLWFVEIWPALGINFVKEEIKQ